VSRPLICIVPVFLFVACAADNFYVLYQFFPKPLVRQVMHVQFDVTLSFFFRAALAAVPSEPLFLCL